MSLPGKRVIGRGREYYDYLKTEAWADVKRRHRSSNLPQDCDVCSAPWHSSMEYHHKTYKNLGCENLRDITPLCWICHRLTHWMQGNTDKNLWKATKVARKFLASFLPSAGSRLKATRRSHLLIERTCSMIVRRSIQYNVTEEMGNKIETECKRLQIKPKDFYKMLLNEYFNSHPVQDTQPVQTVEIEKPHPEDTMVIIGEMYFEDVAYQKLENLFPSLVLKDVLEDMSKSSSFRLRSPAAWGTNYNDWLGNLAQHLRKLTNTATKSSLDILNEFQAKCLNGESKTP